MENDCDNQVEVGALDDSLCDAEETNKPVQTPATTSVCSVVSLAQRNEHNTNNGIYPGSISPYNPTSEQSQDQILEMLLLQSNDIVFDLGCGDARLLQKIIRERPHDGIRCIGIDINTVQIDRAIQSIRKTLTYEQQCNIHIRNESLLTQSSSSSYTNQDEYVNSTIGSNCFHLTLFDDATVVYLFLLPKALIQVKQILDDVIQYRRSKLGNAHDNGSIETDSKVVNTKKLQVVSYMFQIHGWTPQCINRNTKAGAAIYLYDHTIN